VSAAVNRSFAQHVDEGMIRDIAARLRALTASPRGNGLREAAGRLGVAEVGLWQVLDGRGPWPNLGLLTDVCAAAVRHFGVDPVWLVTGDYDPMIHRVAEDQKRDRDRLRSLIADVLRTGAARQAELA
jgi:hypothetical protein